MGISHIQSFIGLMAKNIGKIKMCMATIKMTERAIAYPCEFSVICRTIRKWNSILLL